MRKFSSELQFNCVHHESFSPQMICNVQYKIKYLQKVLVYKNIWSVKKCSAKKDQNLKTSDIKKSMYKSAT